MADRPRSATPPRRPSGPPRVDERAEAEALAELERRIQALASLDWPRLRVADPPAAQAAAQEMLKVDGARAHLLWQREMREVAAENARSERTGRAHQELSRLLPDWSQPVADELRRYAESLGFTTAEIATVDDPRIIVALHRAWRGEQAIDALGGPSRSAGDVPAAPVPAKSPNPAPPRPEPLTQVGRRSSGFAPTPSDSLPVRDWMDARRAEVRKRRSPNPH